jgi:hypothetical protein
MAFTEFPRQLPAGFIFWITDVAGPVKSGAAICALNEYTAYFRR